MAEGQAGNPAPRAVVLWPDGAVRSAVAGGGEGPECIFVASAYEAAAELIAAPALAIVIDLRLMGPRHLRLLQIARERRVEMLAVGSIPSGLTAEDLSGIRLLARADVKAALEKLLQDREGRYEPSPAAVPAEAKQSPRAATPQAAPSPAGAKESSSPSAPPAPESPSQAPADSLRNILTSGELAALLEDQP